MVKSFFDRTPDQPPVPAAPVPEGVRQIASLIDSTMPAIENMTGLSRREIFLQVMKTGIRGGNMNTFLDGLMGRPPEKEVRFIRIVKTLAVWVPVALFLIGFGLATLFLYVRLIMQLTGV